MSFPCLVTTLISDCTNIVKRAKLTEPRNGAVVLHSIPFPIKLPPFMSPVNLDLVVL